MNDYKFDIGSDVVVISTHPVDPGKKITICVRDIWWHNRKKKIIYYGSGITGEKIGPFIEEDLLR